MPKRTQMSNVDAAWLRMEDPTNRMMIVSVMTFSTEMSLEELRSLVSERLLPYRRFRQRVVYEAGIPYWQDDPEFDIANHVERVSLPKPGGRAGLQRYAGQIMGLELDPGRPLWHFALIPKFGGGSAMVSRLHHCIADGMALVAVMLSMADGAAHPHVRDERGRSQTGPLDPVLTAVRQTVTAAGAVLEESVDMIMEPNRLFDRARQGIGLAAAIGKFALVGADSDTPFRGPIGVQKSAAWSKPRPLDQIKQLARGYDATLNDVLMSAVAGGLRRYMVAVGAPVKEVEIRSMIPVNLRPANEPLELGNRFGLVLLSLPVGIESPLARVREVKRRMTDLKQSMEAVAAFGILQAMGMAPEPVRRAIVRSLSSTATTVLTNVPGPRTKLSFSGHPLDQAMFWVPRAGTIGLGISILSYADEVLLGFASDAKLVPDAGLLVTAYEEELAAMQQALQ